ncbi:MAG: hypothetical protein JZU63_05995, partial [Rhodoferax sp.]|nr:hypothetical protein [Rhodoferax sp.]
VLRLGGAADGAARIADRRVPGQNDGVNRIAANRMFIKIKKKDLKFFDGVCCFVGITLPTSHTGICRTICSLAVFC